LGATAPAVARELVQRWADAINRGDREAYLSCYSPALRSGSEVSTPPERIEIAIVRTTGLIQGGAGETEVTLIERRRSGGGWVVGERRLVIDTTSPPPRIVRQGRLRQVWSMSRDSLDGVPRAVRLEVMQRAARRYRRLAGRVDAAQRAAERRARLEEAMSKVALIGIIGSKGSGGEVADVLRSGDVGGDLDGVMSQVKGVGVARSDSLRPVGGSGAGRVVNIGQLRTKREQPTRVHARFRRGRLQRRGGAGELETDAVRRVVGRRVRELVGCYERELESNPGLKGRIDVRFTIDQAGRVKSVSLTQNTTNKAVGDCVTRRIRRYRFPSPEGGDATFEYPLFFEPAKQGR